MTQNTNYFKLGLFIILAFGLTAAMLIAFGAGQFLKTEILAETYFNETVQGLDVGASVKYKGVKIGTVKSITTPTKTYDVASNYVLVTFSLADDCYVGQTGADAGDRMQKAVKEGLCVFLSFNGLTGSAYLETDYQKNGPDPLEIPWTPQNLYVPSRPSTIKRASDAINEIVDTFTSLDLQQVKQDLTAIVKSLDITDVSLQAENLLKELRQTNDSLARFLASDRMKQIVTDAGDSISDLKQMVHNANPPIKEALANIKTASGSFKRMATGLEAGYGTKLSEMSEKMDSVLASLEKTSQLLENMVWTNSDTIEKMVDNIENTAENLNQLTRELRKYPGRILMEAPPETQSLESRKE